jgi:VanZ family protein
MKIRYFLPPFIWGVIIIFLSLTPSNEMPEMNIWAFLSFDKVAHLFFYALLALQLIIAFKKQNSNYTLKYRAVLCAFIISLICGFSTEIMQYYMFAGRSADYLDMIANFIGVSMGCVSFYFIYNQPIKQYKI